MLANLMLTLHFIVLAAGLAGVFWSAQKTLVASVAFSERHAIPKFIVGAIVIGFGTSSPELAVSVLASFEGQSEIAISNVLGSNIINLSLVAGAAAVITHVCASRQILQRYFPIVLVLSLLPAALMLDFSLDRVDGIILLAMLAATLIIAVRKKEMFAEDYADVHQIAEKLHRPEIHLLIGLALLVITSHLTVSSAVEISVLLNIETTFIGLTIIAIGTSLPELAAAVTGAYHKQHDLAVGNLLGSNVFNALGVLGAAAVVRPIAASDEMLFWYFPIMGGIIVLLWVLFMLSKRQCIGKISGTILLAYFFGYLVLLYFFATL